MLYMQDMNEVLMLDMENTGGYAGGSPEAGARFTFADRSNSTLPNDSLDAAAQIAEVTTVSCLSLQTPASFYFPNKS